VTIYRDVFPKLRDEAFRETSDADEEYNCIAWAAEVTDEWWDPNGVWPDGVPQNYEAGSFVEMYERHGFIECNDVELEAGFDKVVIYIKGREVTHAARQLPNGKWTSKLGSDDDIEHDNLSDIAGGDYGEPARYLKRPITPE